MANDTDLRELLAAATTDGVLVLDRELLERAGVEPAGDWPTITIADSKIGGGSELRVSGSCSYLGLDGLEATVTFATVNETASAVVKLVLPDDWSFSRSFDDLDSFLYDLVVRRGVIAVAAHEAVGSDGSVLEPGVNLAIEIELGGVLAPLGRLSSGSRSLLISGVLRPDGTMTFAGQFPVELTIGPLTFTELGLELVTPLSSGTDEAVAIALVAAATVDGDPVDVRGELDIGTSVVSFVVIPADAAMSSWDDVGLVTGLGDAIDPLDDITAASAVISLERLVLTVDLGAKRLLGVGASFGIGGDWDVIDGLLRVSHLTAEITASDLHVARRRKIGMVLRGDTEVGGAVLAVEAGLPDFDVSGTLVADETPTVANLLHAWGLPADDLPTGLTVSSLAIEGRPSDLAFSAAVGLEGVWEMVLGDERVALDELTLHVDHHDSRTDGTISATATVAGQLVTVEVVYDGEWTASASFTGLSLRRLAAVVAAGDLFPTELPDLVFERIKVAAGLSTGVVTARAVAAQEWILPVGPTGIGVSGITLALDRAPTADGGVMSGAVTGTVRLGANSFTVSYSAPGELVLEGTLPSVRLSGLLQYLCDVDTVRNLALPAELSGIELTDVEFSIAPGAPRVSVSADTPIGRIHIVVDRPDHGQWGFSFALLPDPNEGFAAISSAFEVLDELDLSGSALVVSTADRPELVLAGFEKSIDVRRGVNLVASLDLGGLGVDKILGIDRLDVSAAVGATPRDLVLEAVVEAAIELGDGVVLSEIIFRLRLNPGNPSVQLLGALLVDLNGTELSFTGGLEVQPRSAVFSGTMLGRWAEPFGAAGVAVADVAIEIGLSFPPPVPVLSVAGSLQIGDFQGAVAVQFDSAVPTRSMIAVAFSQLFLSDVLRSLCGPEVENAIPASMLETIRNVGFEDVSVYIVPQATSIGELHFEPGFVLRGRMFLWGFQIAAHVEIDYESGLYISGETDPVEIAGLFELAGTGGRNGPSLLLDLRRGELAIVDIQGRVELLGVSSETRLRIDDSGFDFTIAGKIFELFEATITAKGSDLVKGGDFSVAVTMQNDLFAYLREQVTAAIGAAAADATKDLTKAQQDLDRTQAEVDRLGREIDRLRNAVGKERESAQRSLGDARATVASAQRTVNELNTSLANMRRTVERERQSDVERLRAAQRDVTAAQREVDSLQGSINSAHARIRTLRREISNWERWYAAQAWYDKSWAWTRLAAETGWRGAEIGAQYAAIGTLEASRAAANGVLVIAKQVVRGIEAAAASFPIDADPRMLGLYTAQRTATAGLESARWALRQAEQAIDLFPIDADPRVAGVIVARGAATVGLQAADAFLETLKQGIGGVADAATFITEAGLGGLFDVRAASFAGLLSATSGGRVALALEIEFMGEPSKIALSFNFHDPLAAVEELVAELLKA